MDYAKNTNLFDYTPRDIGYHSEKKWDNADKTLESIFLALMAGDERQTEAAQRANLPEANPILGEHPSKTKIRSYFAATALAHMGLADLLPSKYRKVLQGLSVGFEGNVVNQNRNLKDSKGASIGLDAIRW